MFHWMRTMLSLVLVLLFGLIRCASKPDKVSLEEPEKLDREYVNKSLERNEIMGEKDGTVVLQRKQSLEEELARLKDSIDELEKRIYGNTQLNPGGLWLKLRECRKKLSDPRIGGNGVPEPMEKWEKLSSSDPNFLFRVEKKKKVVAVSEEKLEDRIEKLKSLKSILEQRQSDFNEKIDRCEDQYRAQLIKHGLDPEDTEAKGEWVEGPDGTRVWKMRQPPTSNPEELMRRKEERTKKN